MTQLPSPRSRAIWVFLLFQALYGLTSSGNVFRVPDEFETYFQTEHLVDAGNLSVPQTLAIKQRKIRDGRVIGQEAVFFGTFGWDGKPYAPYGPLIAILAVPHHLAGRAIAGLAGVPRIPLPGGIAWLMVVGGVTMVASATAAALAVAGFYRAARSLGASDREALALSLLLGGATVLWNYGTSFFSEAFTAAAFIWAAVFLIEATDARLEAAAKRAVAVASILIFLAGLTKITALVFAPAFVIAALAEPRVSAPARVKTAAALTAAIVMAVAVHAAWNVTRFGDPFNIGYDWSETIPQLPARAFLLSDIPRGLAVLLASPGKSLVLWAPPLVLAAFGLPAFWRLHRGAAAGVITAAVVGLLVFAAYLFPDGGYSHGPRNLVPIVPLALLPGVEACATTRRRGLAVACGIAGLAIALTATSVSYLDDQNIGADLGRGARANYYERIEPAPGRPFNRYRLGYIPFAATFGDSGWWNAPVVGQGPDYFPLHLAQARRQLLDGHAIPLWLIGLIPAVWISLLCVSARALYRG